MNFVPFNAAMAHAARIEESKLQLQALGFTAAAADVIAGEAAKEARETPTSASAADVLERKVREQMLRAGQHEAPDV